MTITGAIVLFAVIWFLALLVALPMGLRTHGDDGVNTSDQPAYAPANFNFRRTVLRVTAISVLLWLPLCVVIASGVISIADIDMRGTLSR